MQSRVYSDEIMEAEKKGLILHEDCFYERVKRTYHDVGIEMSREDADTFEQLYRSFQKKITLGNGVEGFLDYCKSNDILVRPQSLHSVLHKYRPSCPFQRSYNILNLSLLNVLTILLSL